MFSFDCVVFKFSGFNKIWFCKTSIAFIVAGKRKLYFLSLQCSVRMFFRPNILQTFWINYFFSMNRALDFISPVEKRCVYTRIISWTYVSVSSFSSSLSFVCISVQYVMRTRRNGRTIKGQFRNKYYHEVTRSSTIIKCEWGLQLC